MSEELNKKLHLWLGECWHEFKYRKPGDEYETCHCGIPFHYWIKPAYDIDPVAMMKLLEALRKQRYDVELYIYSEDEPYWVKIYSPQRMPDGEKMASGESEISLPLAVALAVEKLIDAERVEERV